MQTGGLLVESGYQSGALLDEGSAVPPAFVTSALPDGDVGTAYSFQLTATGDATITYSVVSGSTGWATVSTSGLITGAPATGVLSFTVQATNAAGSTTRAFTLTTPNEAGGSAELPTGINLGTAVHVLSSLAVVAAALVFIAGNASTPAPLSSSATGTSASNVAQGDSLTLAPLSYLSDASSVATANGEHVVVLDQTAAGSHPGNGNNANTFQVLSSLQQTASASIINTGAHTRSAVSFIGQLATALNFSPPPPFVFSNTTYYVRAEPAMFAVKFDVSRFVVSPDKSGRR